MKNKNIMSIALGIFLVFCLAIIGCQDKSPDEENGTKPEESWRLSDSWKIWGHRNPIATHVFSADPSVTVFEDRVYLYGSNDTLEFTLNNAPSYTHGIQGIRMLSSSDLANWTDHGVINVVGTVNTNPLIDNDEWNASRIINWTGVTRAWAPVVTWKHFDEGPQFFIYWGNGGDGVGVIRAFNPTGPWESPRTSMLVTRQTPNCNDVIYLFDPGVVVDEHGNGYLFFGGGTNATMSDFNNTGQARRVKLGANMMSLAEAPETWYVPYLYEASDIQRLNGRYYFSYSTHWQTSGNDFGLTNVNIAYMVSDDPFGAYPGNFSNPRRVLDRPNYTLDSTDENNHHSMFEFRGQTYIAYHTQKAAEAMGVADAIHRHNGSTTTNNRLRSAFIDLMPINADGSINEVTMTRKGVPQVSWLDPYVKNEAETIGIQGGIYTRPDSTASNGVVVTSIDSGDWLGVYGVDFGSDGPKSFTARVRTPNTAGYTGAIELRIDVEGAGVTSDNGNVTPNTPAGIKGGTVIGHVEIQGEPGKEGQWFDVTTDLTQAVTGVHDLVFVFYSSLGTRAETIWPDSRHKNGFEFDYWQFYK